MTKPTNTTTQAKRDPLLTLLTTGFSGGIEAQEAAGQAELASSSSLPTECYGDTKKALEAAGVAFGEAFSDDALFCPVTLPTGWKIKPTSHSMHCDLVDDKGRVRAGIFYKAAFYDRKADLNAKTRYRYDGYLDGSDDTHLKAAVLDGETIIHELGEYVRATYEDADAMRKLGVAWLDEHYPDWKDVGAYWD